MVRKKIKHFCFVWKRTQPMTLENGFKLFLGMFRLYLVYEKLIAVNEYRKPFTAYIFPGAQKNPTCVSLGFK